MLVAGFESTKLYVSNKTGLDTLGYTMRWYFQALEVLK